MARPPADATEWCAMVAVRVQFVRLFDVDSYPGWVDCVLTDAFGAKHTLRDKVPIFTADSLTAESVFPCDGEASCEVLACWDDEAGRQLVRITTERPFDIESMTGDYEFVVLAEQLVNC
jgi:hypothetical protein